MASELQGGDRAALRTQDVCRVLFVDDDLDLTRSMTMALRKQPWECVAANSGADALEILENLEVDVVVSDQRMPGMNGVELLEQVHERYPHVVLLMLTGEADLADAAKAVNDANVFRFLLKPCRSDELAQSVAQAVELAAERKRKRQSDERSSSLATSRRLAFEQALASAWMAFQPVVSPASKRTVAYESLLRLDHPEVAHPGKLLQLAESLGRVEEVEAFVLKSVAARLADAPSHASLLVNVHPLTLAGGELSKLFAPLAPHASRVVVEVIERNALDDNASLQERLNLLRGMGFRIAIDDLGAGYSGLTNFLVLKPDIVKLDMALIRGIDRDPTRIELVESISRLCRKLGIKTIAEGVETVAELRCVVDLGCDWVQGFVYAKAAREFFEPL